MPSITTAEALKLAQQAYPLDLVARLRYIDQKWDSCDADDLAAWREARNLTRNGMDEAIEAGEREGETAGDHTEDISHKLGNL